MVKLTKMFIADGGGSLMDPDEIIWERYFHTEAAAKVAAAEDSPDFKPDWQEVGVKVIWDTGEKYAYYIEAE